VDLGDRIRIERDDDQLAVIMSVASLLSPEKRAAFLERLAGHLKLLCISKPTDRELDTACRVALQRGFGHDEAQRRHTETNRRGGSHFRRGACDRAAVD
jgi:hypothetical protein